MTETQDAAWAALMSAKETWRRDAHRAGAELAEVKDINAELVAALEHVRSLIVEGALVGFNCGEGDWAERLFASQAMTFEAVKKAGGNPHQASAAIAKATGEPAKGLVGGAE